MPLIKLVYSPKNMNKNDTDKFLTMKVDSENSNFKNYKHLALYVNSQNTVKSLKQIHILYFYIFHKLETPLNQAENNAKPKEYRFFLKSWTWVELRLSRQK
jgi:hypothetical protein